METSNARHDANRANAQHSTGPTSAAGKAKASLNAIKTGLTGRTVLLPTDDSQAYREHVARHFTHLAPVNEEENTLVQYIADTEWRLLRIAPLEASIYAIGFRELGYMVEDEPDPANRDALLMGYIFQTYRRDLSNLALQERRLRNQHKFDSEKLQAMQQARVEKERADMQRALQIADAAKQQNLTFDPAEFGFEFSVTEINRYRSRIDTHRKLTGQLPNVDKVLAAFRKEQKVA
jgi:hypothetical protein